MARARNIKPAIMDNEDLAALDPLTRLLFIYLWMLADRDGRLEDRPKRIAVQALPYDRAADVDSMLDELNKGGFIHRYQVGGLKIIQVVSFAKHQTPHVREASSTLPIPEQGTTKAVPEHNLGSAETSPRSPDSLIPDSLIPDSGLLEPSPRVADESAQPPKAKKVQRGARLPQDWVLPKAWGDWALEKYPHWTHEVVREEALKFSNHWRSATKNATKLDWQATWQNWCMNDLAQRAHPPPRAHSETDYQRSMRERVAEAAGSYADVVAAKPPKPFWEQKTEVIDATTTPLIASS